MPGVFGKLICEDPTTAKSRSRKRSEAEAIAERTGDEDLEVQVALGTEQAKTKKILRQRRLHKSDHLGLAEE